MKKYITEYLHRVDYNEGEQAWWSLSEESTKEMLSDKDLYLLVKTIRYIINNDFKKIKNLSKYLINIAKLLNVLELPIMWTLPSGLTIKQSYLKSESTSISPFMYSKIKLNLKVTVRDKYDNKKQIRAFMPNLIHSLDATSLNLLYEQFIKAFQTSYETQFFPVHDCFGTTCDKAFVLKVLLAFVYTDIYSNDPYLYKFDNFVLDHIENNIKDVLDRENRTVILPNRKTKYLIHDLDWVLNKKKLSTRELRKIDYKYILI